MLDQNILKTEPQNPIASIVDTETNTPLKKINELFKNSIGLTWSKKWRFIFLNIIPKVIGFLPFVILGIVYVIILFQIGFSKSVISVSIIAGILAILCLFFLISCILWSQSAYINYLLTNEESKKAILKNSRKKVWKLLWVIILSSFVSFGYLILFLIIATLFYFFVTASTIAIIIGTIMFLIFLVHGIIRAIKFSLAPLACLIDDKTGMLAIKHSEFLTLGYRWAIFKRSLVYGYFQFLVQILITLAFAIIGLLSGLDGFVVVLGVILIIILFFINIFIGLLLEPLGYVYNFDIYNNLKLNKQVSESKEKYSLGQKIVVLLLMIIFPIMAIGFSLLINFISPEKDNSNEAVFSSLINKVAPGIIKTPSDNNLIDWEEENSTNPETTIQEQIKVGDYLVDSLISMTDAEALELNTTFTEFYKTMPTNTNQEDIPTYNETEFQLLISDSGIDTNKVNLLSIEKKKFIWNNYQVGLLETKAQQSGMFKDSDLDGLSDDDETIYKTDINNPDTDGDGYFDGEEVQNGYDPAITGDAKLK